MGRGRSSSSGRGSSSSSGSWSSSRGSSRSGSSSRTTVIWHSRSSYHGNGSFSLLPIAIILLIIGAIMTMFIVPSIFEGFNYGSVSAKCIKNVERNTWYYTTYEYVVDGVEYVNESEEGWEFPETVGKTVTIYYLKDDPTSITEKNPGIDSADGIILVIGLVFVGVGIYLIFLSKKLKAKKEIGNNGVEERDFNNQEISNTNSRMPEKIKCHYCGCKYNPSLNSCPSCGAGNIKE